MRFGLLLVNVGTPEAPTPKAVGRYLREFLMDPYVIDIPKLLRWILVRLLIVPRRRHVSARAYKTIWTDRGSPLRYHLTDLQNKVQAELGSEWLVESGMRYGEPGLRLALEKLRAGGVESLVVLPLYPQYAESSSRSAIEKIECELSSLGWSPKLKTIRSFHDDHGHIAAWTNLFRESVSSAAGEAGGRSHVLFSYHGLPERHLQKAEKSSEGNSEKRLDSGASFCLDGGQPIRAESEVRKYACCEKALSMKCQANQTCYRAQAVETTHLIAKAIGLKKDEWSISFQSRLGRTPWIKPYTDDVIPQLVESGVANLTVMTPSFVADCLETIEEIGDRAREQFLTAGGKNFLRVECLNSRSDWVKAVADMARRSASSAV